METFKDVKKNLEFKVESREKPSIAADPDKPADDVKERKIYVGGVPLDMTERDIYQFFSEKFGQVEFVLGRKNKANNRFAFVTFESKETAQSVLSADFSKLTTQNGRKLRVGRLRERGERRIFTSVYTRRPQSGQSVEHEQANSWRPKRDENYNMDREYGQFSDGGITGGAVEYSRVFNHQHNYQQYQQVVSSSPDLQYDMTGAGAMMSPLNSNPYFPGQQPAYYLSNGYMIWPQFAPPNFPSYQDMQYGQESLADVSTYIQTPDYRGN